MSHRSSQEPLTVESNSSLSDNKKNEIILFDFLNKKSGWEYYNGDILDVKINSEDQIPLSVDMPSNVILKVIETEPGVKGNTATNALKPATVETGAKVNVPLFIDEGYKIKIDCSKGTYLERIQ